MVSDDAGGEALQRTIPLVIIGVLGKRQPGLRDRLDFPCPTQPIGLGGSQSAVSVRKAGSTAGIRAISAGVTMRQAPETRISVGLNRTL